MVKQSPPHNSPEYKEPGWSMVLLIVALSAGICGLFISHVLELPRREPKLPEIRNEQTFVPTPQVMNEQVPPRGRKKNSRKRWATRNDSNYAGNPAPRP